MARYYIPGRRFLYKVIFLVAIVRVSLWLLPFRLICRAVRKINVINSAKKTKFRGWPTRQQIADTITVGSHYIPKATCLTQALTAQIMLKHYGYPADLQIGVAWSETGQFEAHAWIESDGAVVIGGTTEDLERFSVLPEFGEKFL